MVFSRRLDNSRHVMLSPSTGSHRPEAAPAPYSTPVLADGARGYGVSLREDKLREASLPL
jgi:hypothetical protein